MAVDPGKDTDAMNPQSWNKYAYVRNNPMRSVDPNGKQGIPTTPEAMKQMTATALVQQAAPQLRQAELADGAKKLEMAGRAVCDGAAKVGDVGGKVTAAATLASFTPAAPVAAPTAALAGPITVAADLVTAGCDPSPEHIATIGADALELTVAAHTAAALAKAKPGLAAETVGKLSELTGLVVGAVAHPAMQATMELPCP